MILTDMTEKFKLRTWSVGFEVPFYDTSDDTGVAELSQNLADRYRDWFDVLKVNLDILELPSSNKMILYTIVVREDVDYVSTDTVEDDWVDMQNSVINDLEVFLKLRNLEYRKVC